MRTYVRRTKTQVAASPCKNRAIAKPIRRHSWRTSPNPAKLGSGQKNPRLAGKNGAQSKAGRDSSLQIIYKVVPRLKGGITVKTTKKHMFVTMNVLSSRKLWALCRKHGGGDPVTTLIRLSLEGRLAKA